MSYETTLLDVETNEFVSYNDSSGYLPRGNSQDFIFVKKDNGYYNIYIDYTNTILLVIYSEYPDKGERKKIVRTIANFDENVKSDFEYKIIFYPDNQSISIQDKENDFLDFYEFFYIFGTSISKFMINNKFKRILFEDYCFDSVDNKLNIFNKQECITWCNANRNKCSEFKKNYCTPSRILGNNTDCINYCKEGNCEDTLNTYCTILDDNQDISNLCGCHKPSTFYTSYIDDLKNIFANIPSDVKGECVYKRCVDSDFKSSTYKNNCIDSPFKDCIKNINLNETGNITNKNAIEINIDNGLCKNTFKRKIGSCETDYVVADDGVTCRKCGDKEIYIENRTKCQQCTGDDLPNADKSQCVKPRFDCSTACNPSIEGQFTTRGECEINCGIVTCSGNTIYNDTRTGCIECGPNTLPNTDRTECVAAKYNCGNCGLPVLSGTYFSKNQCIVECKESPCTGNNAYNQNTGECDDCGEKYADNDHLQCISGKYGCENNCVERIGTGIHETQQECRTSCGIADCLGNERFSDDFKSCISCGDDAKVSSDRTRCIPKKYSCSNNCASKIENGTYDSQKDCVIGCEIAKYGCDNDCEAGIDGDYATETECKEKCKDDDKKSNTMIYVIIGIVVLLLLLLGGLLIYKNSKKK